MEKHLNFWKHSFRLKLLLVTSLIFVFLWTKSMNRQDEISDTKSTRALKKRYEYPFVIQVLTWNRPKSLQRLLNSLKNSEYGSDTVHLVIHLEGGYDLQTEVIAEEFEWPHGERNVTKLEKRRGLAYAWFHAWRPRNPQQRSVILEDDISVSPAWYRWLNAAWDHYQGRGDIAAVSLQRQTLIPWKPNHQFQIVNDHKPFLFMLLGSIGFSPHPVVWKNFLGWLDSIDDDYNIDIPNLVTTDWYHRAGPKGHMWEQHFIYYSKWHGLYTLYVNLPDKKTLAADMREKGQHFDKTLGTLFQVATNVTLDFPTVLNRYNFNGKFVDSK